MSITNQQKIELMQLAKEIASNERALEFAARHELPAKVWPESEQTIPATCLEITLHIYRQLLSEVSEQ